MDEELPILMQKVPGGHVPYGAHSGDMLDALVVDQVFTCTPRKGRTLPRNAAYWADLQFGAKATEAWPTS